MLTNFRKLILLAVAGAFSIAGTAAEVTIVIQDDKGRPLENAVVGLTPTSGDVALSELPKPEVRQEGALFDPFVLPVRTGATVNFPNLDEVRHHVYSFSKAKRFELRLYGQDETKFVTFDKAGIVALGCNIHDNMLAYVYVTDAPLIRRTANDGTVSFTGIPDGKYTFEVWHPDQRRKQPNVPAEIAVANSTAETVKVSLKRVRRHQMPPAEDDYN